MSENGRVQENGQSTTGKPKSKVNGKWYFYDKTVHDFPSVNQSIEFGIGSFQLGDKTMYKITWWKPAGSVQEPSSSGKGNDSPHIEEASLRFISNVIGNAVAKGSCENPMQVIDWFRAAKFALIDQPYPGKIVPLKGPVPGIDDRQPEDEWDGQGVPF